MKNIIDICREFGFEIPADKQADFNRAVAENYKTVADYDKAVRKRDEYKASLEDVQTKLDGFKDVDVSDLKSQIATLTTQLDNEKSARKADAAKAVRERNVQSFLEGKQFVNDITAQSIQSQLMSELEQNTGESVEQIYKRLTSDKDGNPLANILAPGADGKPHFTQPTRQGGGKSGTMTRDEIMSIKDRSERRNAIAQNMHLFSKGE